MDINKNLKEKISYYEYVDYSTCKNLYDKVIKKLVFRGFENSEILKNCEFILNDLSQILQHGNNSSCYLLKSNGYYSFSKIIFKYFKLLDHELEKKNEKKLKKNIDKLEAISKFLKKLNVFLVEISNMTNLNDEDARNKFIEQKENYPDLIKNSKLFEMNENLFLNNSSNVDLKKDDLKLENEFTQKKNEKVEFEKKFSMPLITPNIEFGKKFMELFVTEYENDFSENLYGKYAVFWLDEEIRSFFKFYMFFLPFFRSKLKNYLKLVFSSKFRCKTMNRLINEPTINFPFNVWNITELYASLIYVKIETRKTKTKCKTVFIPKQNSIIINNQKNEEKISIKDEHSISFMNEHIRCRLIKPVKTISKNLIVHMHGGGFFTQSPDSHEIYLRPWCKETETTILSIDYTKKTNFPNSLNDCLDVYIWLKTTKEENLIDLFGFKPEKIILTGDSSGGNLAISLVLVLNDLRKYYTNKFNFIIPMPDGLQIIYAPLYMAINPSSSRLISTLDILIPTALQLIVVSAYTGRTENLKENNWKEAFKSFLFPDSDPKPWFRCIENIDETVKDYSYNLNSPYLSPLLYKDFNSLTDVPLNIVTAEYCSFLDESITLSKFWKGPISLDVVNDLNHGFLNIRNLCNLAKKGSRLCSHRLKTMLES